MFQFSEYQLFEESVEKDVAFGPMNFGIKKDEAYKIAHEALKTVGIKEEYFKKSPFDLSGGEKRRVSIAGILALKPDILVLDEPTAGLDPIGAKEMLSLFKSLNEQGVTIILVTHDMNIVFEYADDVVVMDQGKVVYHGSTDDLFFKDVNTKINDLVRKDRQVGNAARRAFGSTDEMMAYYKEAYKFQTN